MLELIVIKRRRSWDWRVHDQNGKIVAGGREKTRPAARYHAYRALLLVIAMGARAADLSALSPGPVFSRSRQARANQT